MWPKPRPLFKHPVAPSCSSEFPDLDRRNDQGNGTWERGPSGFGVGNPNMLWRSTGCQVMSIKRVGYPTRLHDFAFLDHKILGVPTLTPEGAQTIMIRLINVVWSPDERIVFVAIPC